MITKAGTLAFKVLEKQAIEVACDKQDAWVVGALQDAAPIEDTCGVSPQEYAEKATISLHLKGSRLVSDNEFQVEGHIDAIVPALCSRCGEPITSTRKSDFIQYYQLVENESEATDSGDADLIMTTEAHINLRNMISERLVILEPMIEHHPDGTCHVAPEIESPDENHEVKSNPFTRLKGLKLD